MKKALICGITGQDGSYLAKLLLNKNYEVWGTSRDVEMSNLSNLVKLNIVNQVKLVSMLSIDFKSVLQIVIDCSPDEIYNLSGQSSVRLSFDQPIETLESISMSTLNLLEAIKISKLSIKFYNAGSSECFGDTGLTPANELSPFRPMSPYAIAKSAAYWLVSNYRNSYRLFCCSGILFNHESHLRPERFVTKKIISTACRIFLGSEEKLNLGNLEIKRDWGWSPEYVNAMWLMLQQSEPTDYIIATGQSNSLYDFALKTFSYLNLNLDEFLVIDHHLIRPTDILNSYANPTKAEIKLGWSATVFIDELISKMVIEELESLKNG